MSIFSVIRSQNSPIGIIITPYNNLLINLDNAILCVAQQSTPVKLNQLSNIFYSGSGNSYPIEIHGNDGNFWVHPDSLGVLEITLQTNLGNVYKHFKVIQAPAIGYIDSKNGDGTSKFNVNEFKNQIGLIPVLEGYGFDAKCRILKFNVMRISSNGRVFKATNNDRRFNNEVLWLIRKAKSSDIYLFRNIEYKCPGNITIQRIRDMIFEIE
jgi:hypothetical protein